MSSKLFPADYRPNWFRTIFFLLATALTTWLFYQYGSDSNVAQEPRSIFHWISMQWNSENENFAYGWIMIVVSVYIAWRKREELCNAAVKPSWVGTIIVLGSLLVHFLAFRSQMPRISLAAVVGVYWGLIYAFWGWHVAKLLIFPASYILLCFCNYFFNEITMPLRLLASQIAVGLLHGVGIEAIRRGTVVLSMAGGGFQFDVEQGCSGLRSLVVITALAAPYAYLNMKGAFKQVTLFVLSIPLAILANSLRIFSIGVIAEFIGMKRAMALYHDFSGHLLFAISILLLIGAASLLNKDWKAILCNFLSKKPSRG